MQFFLEVEQLLLLALEHLGYGNAGPARYNIGDVIAIDLLLDKGFIALHIAQLLLYADIFVLFLLDERVADFGNTAIVPTLLGTLGFEVELLDVNLVLLDFINQFLLGFPLGVVIALAVLEFGNLLIKVCNALLIAIALDGCALDFELGNLAGNLIKSLGHAVHLDAQFGCSLIDQVDGLVGQEAVTDVTLAELNGSDDGVILDAHLVVVLVFLLQTTQDGNGAFLVGFIDHDNLETTLQGLVLLEVLLVLVEGRGADAAQFSTSQGRLENVGSIHSTAALASTHKGVDLIDKQNDFAVCLGDFVND